MWQIWNWFLNLLYQWNLYQKNATILFLGLDNSGKTTLLKMLKEGRVTQSAPTFHPNEEELVMDSIKFRTIDLGGHQQARRLWNDYYVTCDALVFLIDTADHSRFEEAKNELHRILYDDKLSTVPILILGNKIDLPAAVSEERLRMELQVITNGGKEMDDYNVGYNTILSPEARPIEIFMCSIKDRYGYGEGFKWLGSVLK